MKIIVTTSDDYLHIVPIFCYLFNKYWDDQQKVEIVCYDGINDFIENSKNKSSYKIPDNFNFVSMGVQSKDAGNFTRDLRRYFAEQDEWFIWMMEDTFIKSKVDQKRLQYLFSLTQHENVGRINLTNEGRKQKFENYCVVEDLRIVVNTQDALYRLSTQPSIWNRNYLLKYMQNDIGPWEFETQQAFNDGYRILGPELCVVKHNEGVRKFDLFKYNFDGIEQEVINEMKALNII